jgi:hypothetical protein
MAKKEGASYGQPKTRILCYRNRTPLIKSAIAKDAEKHAIVQCRTLESGVKHARIYSEEHRCES